MTKKRKKDFLYTPYFCEENIWKLCGNHVFKFDSWVVFMTNENRTCAIWEQKKAPQGEAIIWDYHVFLIHVSSDEKTVHVFDFDTRLDFGIEMKTYFQHSFPPMDYPESYNPLFRVQAAELFLKEFKSNREHMKKGGKFVKEPPPWEKISEESNLDDYLNPRFKSEEILTLEEMTSTFFLQKRKKEESYS